MKKKVLFISLILLINLIFIDIAHAEQYNNYSTSAISCGDELIKNVPTMLPKVVSIIYTVIQIAVPILLVVFGSLDLMKGISAQKEDEIKKGQQMFIKRIISAVIVFFVLIIVKLVISLVADKSSNRILDCTECFIRNNEKCIAVVEN